MKASIAFQLALLGTTSLLCAQSGSPRPSDPTPRSTDSAIHGSRTKKSDTPSRPSTPPTTESTESSQESVDDMPAGDSQAPPLSSSESSSRDSIIDLSPPKDDAKNHPGANSDLDSDSDINEFKPWDPHKAAKDIEVGDYYAKRKNYSAAISRYRDALAYKPKDALATYKLAEALEKNSEFEEARQNYQAYLQILPTGELAEQAKKAVERLAPKADAASSALSGRRR